MHPHDTAGVEALSVCLRRTAASPSWVVVCANIGLMMRGPAAGQGHGIGKGRRAALFFLRLTMERGLTAHARQAMHGQLIEVVACLLHSL